MWHRSFISPDTTLGSHVFWSIKSATAKKLICFVQMIEAIALVGEMGLQAIPLEFIIGVGILSNRINKALLYFLKAIQSGLLSNLPFAL